MKDHERNYYVANIVAGQYRCEIAGQHFVIRAASPVQQAEAETIFKDSYDQAGLAGAYSEEELNHVLAESGVYTEKNEEDRLLLEKNMEDQKVGLLENAVRSNVREVIRQSLDQARKEHLKLTILKHSHDHLSSLGIAQIAKSRYLLGCSVYYIDGRAYWDDPHAGWNSPDLFLDKILFKMRNFHLSEGQIRELVRTDPWRSMWNAAKYCGNKIFDCPSSQLTVDQKSLISWSSIYESIYENSNCPAENIIEDDDMLDGWMIVQRRERIKHMDKKIGDELIKNDKIKNSSEIFIVADKKDVTKVLNMNSEQSRMTLDSRLNTVKKHGEVNEAQMPDTIIKNQQAVMNAFANTIKGK